MNEVMRESDERTMKLLEKTMIDEARNFNAIKCKSLEVMPIEDDTKIFRQQDRRVSWGRKGAKYVAARHYASVDNARDVIDELRRRGCNKAYKEEEVTWD